VGCVTASAVVGRQDPHRAAAWVRRGVLVSLLVTQVLVFRAVQWVGVAGLLLDLLVFALLEVALREGSEEADEAALGAEEASSAAPGDASGRAR
jgi:hypothetical protein